MYYQLLYMHILIRTYRIQKYEYCALIEPHENAYNAFVTVLC